MDPLAPLSLLISLSGVGMIILVVWLAMRRLPPVKLGAEAGVRDRISHEQPTFQIGKVLVDASDQDAIAGSADGSDVVLQFVMGGRAITWRFPIAKLPKVELHATPDGKSILQIHTGEFTRPVLAFPGIDAAHAASIFPGLQPQASRGAA